MWKWFAAPVAVAVIAAGLWFEPWRLVTSSEIDEPLPGLSGQVVAPPAPSSQPPSPSPSPSREATRQPTEQPAEQPAPEIVELAAGDFETAEHETSGRARILELADGSRYLRLDDLATSDGPDLDVWITDQPSGGSWGSYDDGRYVQLGELKATNGDQNYEIPQDADLDGMTSVVIWCVRFDVAFGTAPVTL